MNSALVLVAALFAIGSLGIFVYMFVQSRQRSSLRNLMGGGGGIVAETRRRLEEDETGEELLKIKAQTKRQAQKRKPPTLEEKFFMAGMFSESSRKDFRRLQLICPLILVPVGLFIGAQFEAVLAIAIAALGFAWSLQLPFTILDRRISARHEDIMYYLPLVIEQISIGVSSSLDVGPCLQRVVTMADERDTHNVVTELIRHSQYYIKSGVPLEEALVEVGKASGHTELKHAFMSLSQVARHGGEISKQLQELADAVSKQREAKVDETIKKLELKATGPVGLVFLGFLIIFLTGLFMRLKDAF